MEALKFFDIFILRPEVGVMFGFVVIILIIISIKIGAIDKKIAELEEKINKLEDKTNELLEKISEAENEGELDIIDKYLRRKNVDSILDLKQTDPIKADRIITGSKISSLLDPRGD